MEIPDYLLSGSEAAVNLLCGLERKTMDLLRERKEVTLRNFENQSTSCNSVNFANALKTALNAALGDVDKVAGMLASQFFIITPERAEMAFMPSLEAYEHEARERAAEFAKMGHTLNMINFHIDAIIANAANMTHFQLVEKIENIRGNR